MLKVRNSLLRAVVETAIGKITSKGQITLPKGVRDALGVTAGDRIIFDVEGERAIIRRVPRESLAVLFSRQKPWKIRAIPYQRATRNEWASRRH
jgi:antitoxin PrlF